MKKLSIIFSFIFVLVLISAPVFAQPYFGKDILLGGEAGYPDATKTWDEEAAISPDETVTVDLYLRGCTEAFTSTGVQLNYDTSCITVASGNGFVPPWQTGANIDIDNIGGWAYFGPLHFTGVAPDGDGDIPMGVMTLHCEGAGNCEVTATSITAISNNVGVSQTIYDPIATNVFTIHQTECTQDAECDDENPCTVDTCNLDTYVCVHNPVPDDTPCDEDGLWCTGTDTCQAGVCEAGTPPCLEDPPNECTDDCVEATHDCYVCNATDFSDPCCGNPACAGEDVCTIEITEFYVDGINGSNITGNGSEGNPWKTITYALGMVPSLVELDDNNRALVHVAAATYDTDMGPIGGGSEIFPLLMVEYVSLQGEGYYGTIISADQSDNVIEFPKERDIQHVTLDGFTITGGENFRGGGIAVYWADPVISNCHITGNVSEDINGGGIYLQNSDAIISNCIISNNTAFGQRGGGISSGAVSDPTIINCTIVNNGAGCGESEGGGGLMIGKDGFATVINTIFWDNYNNCYVCDGGVDDGERCEVEDFQACPGGTCSTPDPELNQVLVQGDATFTVDYSCVQGGEADVKLYHACNGGDNDGEACDDDDDCPAGVCSVACTLNWGAGNTDQDPNFFSTDYYLMYGSSCIDSADSGLTTVIPETDIDENDRYDHCPTPNTGVGPYEYYDRGAHEYQGDSDLDGILDDGDESCSVDDNPCTGEATEDCDDNCIYDPNPDQADEGDNDGVGDTCDNCPQSPNGPLLGTCGHRVNANLIVITDVTCTVNEECGTGNLCESDQVDSNENGIGDVCECEADFDGSHGVDGQDFAFYFLPDWLRTDCNEQGQPPCEGDFDDSGGVDGVDFLKVLEDWLRTDCP